MTFVLASPHGRCGQRQPCRVRGTLPDSGDPVPYRGDFRDSNRVRSYRGRRAVLFSASVRHAVQQCRVRRALSKVRQVLLVCPPPPVHAATRVPAARAAAHTARLGARIGLGTMKVEVEVGRTFCGREAAPFESRGMHAAANSARSAVLTCVLTSSRPRGLCTGMGHRQGRRPSATPGRGGSWRRQRGRPRRRQQTTAEATAQPRALVGGTPSAAVPAARLPRVARGCRRVGRWPDTATAASRTPYGCLPVVVCPRP